MLFSFLVSVFLLTAIGAESTHPTLSVSKQASLIDEELDIKVCDLLPRQSVIIEAKMRDPFGNTWSSSAEFIADANGVIRLERDAPVSGSYQNVDPMGLFWTMKRVSEQGACYKMVDDCIAIQLRVLADGQVLAETHLHRWRKSPGIQRIFVYENGLFGALYLPDSNERLPVIITLGGSSGGLSESRAQVLASHGFAVLALAYFNADGLPSSLKEIPMEYFQKAFHWLRQRPELSAEKIGLYGVSRGAELALLLGSLFPEEIGPIVAVVPSSVVFPGLNEKAVDAWTYQGKPVLPNVRVPQLNLEGGAGASPDLPASSLSLFLEAIEDKEAIAAAAIRVEKIQSSLLLISGGDDAMWPSTFFAQQIVERLREKGSPISCTHLDYPKAGHSIGIPMQPASGPLYYHPVGRLWFTLGGSEVDDEMASRDSWNKTVAFFQEGMR